MQRWKKKKHFHGKFNEGINMFGSVLAELVRLVIEFWVLVIDFIAELVIKLQRKSKML